MSAKNHVIVIPGLNNKIKLHTWACKGWEKFGIITHVFDIRWQIEENGFQTKLERAVKLVDSLSEKDSKISVVGNSAGSSFALNLFGARKKQVSRVVINCGRVRDGDWPWFTFNQATASSPSFKESVLKAQELEKTLTTYDRKKILTLRPLFDEIIPPSTVPVQGAKNITIFSLEHAISIALNMTLFQKRIIDFILS